MFALHLAMSLLHGGGPPATFTNPVYAGADPWMVQHGPHYYLCQSENDLGVSVWKSQRLSDRGRKQVVWRAPQTGWNSRQVWAPELHRLDGRWYIYYAASDGENANHQMGVLGATTDDPQGPYAELGTLYTGDDVVSGEGNRWAIDGTVLELRGRRYFIWSGWPAAADIQFLYVAPLLNPWTTIGNRVRICGNDDFDWERVEDDPNRRGLNEAPQVIRHGGRVFIVYSCGASWLPGYKLGLLYMDEQADPMVPSNWSKLGRPAFMGDDRVHGAGHASFVKSPDGTQDWIVYHSKRSPQAGWERVVWLQPFAWGADDLPDFGSPFPPGEPLPLPSGEIYHP